jgi:hypothetical protein
MEPKTLEPLRRKTFSRFDEIPTGQGAHNGYFCIPSQTNHTSFDFYVPQYWMLVQITIGQKHGINGKELKLPQPRGILMSGETFILALDSESFFFVINFDQFRKQPYLSTKSTPLTPQTLLDQIENQFNQYAWEVDVGVQQAIHLSKQRKTKVIKVSLETLDHVNQQQ